MQKLQADLESEDIQLSNCTSFESLCCSFADSGYSAAEGKLYDFKGERTVDALSAYSLGGYKSGTATPIPPPKAAAPSPPPPAAAPSVAVQML